MLQYPLYAFLSVFANWKSRLWFQNVDAVVCYISSFFLPNDNMNYWRNLMNTKYLNTEYLKKNSRPNFTESPEVMMGLLV